MTGEKQKLVLEILSTGLYHNVQTLGVSRAVTPRNA